MWTCSSMVNMRHVCIQAAVVPTFRPARVLPNKGKHNLVHTLHLISMVTDQYIYKQSMTSSMFRFVRRKHHKPDSNHTRWIMLTTLWRRHTLVLLTSLSALCWGEWMVQRNKTNDIFMLPCPYQIFSAVSNKRCVTIWVTTIGIQIYINSEGVVELLDFFA